jgi:hypothetical protein
MEAGIDIFDGLEEYENDFAGIENDELVVSKGNWTEEEKHNFLVGLRTYGKGNWVEIATVVKTR